MATSCWYHGIHTEPGSRRSEEKEPERERYGAGRVWPDWSVDNYSTRALTGRRSQQVGESHPGPRLYAEVEGEHGWKNNSTQRRRDRRRTVIPYRRQPSAEVRVRAG